MRNRAEKHSGCIELEESVHSSGARICAALGAMAVMALLFSADVALVQGLLPLDSATVNLSASAVSLAWLAGAGVALACVGVSACRFLALPSGLRSALLVVFSCALLFSGFVLLMRCFGVSGASSSAF
jgi:hypothetical protein